MTNLTLPNERELSLTEAHARVLQDLTSLGFVNTAQTLGHTLVNTRVILTDHQGTLRAAGSGKGYIESARVGGLFEALEHYLTGHYILHTDIELRPASSFKCEGLFQDDSLLETIRERHAETLACRHYLSPLDHAAFYYPIALSLPTYAQSPLVGDTFNYASLRRYCSNSGIAIGATYNEAALHAINECLERDALSLFLLDHFYYRHDRPVLKVERPLPGSCLAEIWRDCETELNTEVIVLDISSEFCVKTYIAFTSSGNHPVTVFGCGTSLSPTHAVSRALTELVQIQWGATCSEVAQHIELQMRHLAAFPRLQSCLRMNTKHLLNTTRLHVVTVPATETQLPLHEQISMIASNVRSHQRELGISILYQTDHGTTLANAVIPGLERFYIVSSGNVVIPQARGRAFHARYRSLHE